MAPVKGLIQVHEPYEALRLGRYNMHFQPIKHTQSDDIFGFEALLRGPEGTPMAEPEGLFSGDGRLMGRELATLDMACIGSALRGGSALASKYTLFVNLRAETLGRLCRRTEDFLGFLDELGLDPAKLVFEISESTDPSELKAFCTSLGGLLASGIRFAVDDVGGSFHWLHNMLCLEPMFLKLDKSFVREISVFKSKQAVVSSLALMSGKMDMHVVAEGVQDAGELQTVRDFGVGYVQGYFLGRPQPAGAWFDRASLQGDLV